MKFIDASDDADEKPTTLGTYKMILGTNYQHHLCSILKENRKNNGHRHQ